MDLTCQSTRTFSRHAFACRWSTSHFEVRQQECPLELVAAIPKLASLEIERSLAFFEGLGFVRRGSYPEGM